MENLSFVTALGWTLVHACWQIVLISLLYLGIKLCTKKAHIRYWSGISLLFSQFIMSVVTYGYLNQSFNVKQKVLMPLNYLSIQHGFQGFINQNINIITILWAIGFGILFLKVCLGYIFIFRIKRDTNNKSDAKLELLMRDLMQRMQISKQVLIKTTQNLDLPIMLGTIKPLILIPLGLMTKLNAEQLEFVLAHELAHVKRYDYLLNGIQSILDSIYFFHPAFWFLSSEIRNERENCCDDLAMKQCKNPLVMAKTLVYIQEYAKTPQLALAFGKKQFTILDRVKRILGQKNKSNYSRESIWIFLAVCVSFFALAQTPKEEAEIKNSTEVSKMAIRQDSLSKPKVNFGNNAIEIRDKEVFVNNKKIEVDDDTKKQIAEKVDQVNQSEKEMNISIAEMNDKVAVITANVSKMRIAEINALVEKMQPNIKRISEIASKYSVRMSDINLSDKQMAEIEKRMNKEIDAENLKIEKYNHQIEKINNDNSQLNEENDKLNAEIEKLQVPVDIASEKFSNSMEEMMESLPESVKIKFNNSIKPPKPPKPPKAPKVLKFTAPKTPRAPKEPKVIKFSPPAPPAPPRNSDNN